MANIKGSGWLAALEYFQKKFGNEAVEKVKVALNEEERKILFKNVLPISWLNYDTYMKFLIQADRILGKGDKKLVQESSIYCAQKDLKGGIYGIFISFISPQLVLRSSALLWKQYYDKGKLKVESKGEKHLWLMLTEFPDIPLYHEFEHIPYMEECLRISGGKNPHGIQHKCIARGDENCFLEFKWE